jgi:hypothetical protein
LDDKLEQEEKVESDDTTQEFTLIPTGGGLLKAELAVTDADGKKAEAETRLLPVAVREEEDEADWKKSAAVEKLTGDWRKDLVSVAISQIGYRESKKDFIIDEDGSWNRYSRYAGWYDDVYGTDYRYDPWDAMFVSFCLNYAEVSEEVLPREAASEEWITQLEESEAFRQPGEGYQPEPGDLIFLMEGEDEPVLHVAIVEKVSGKDGQIGTIEGYVLEDEEEELLIADADQKEIAAAESKTESADTESESSATETRTERESAGAEKESESEPASTEAAREPATTEDMGGSVAVEAAGSSDVIVITNETDPSEAEVQEADEVRVLDDGDDDIIAEDTFNEDLLNADIYHVTARRSYDCDDEAIAGYVSMHEVMKLAGWSQTLGDDDSIVHVSGDFPEDASLELELTALTSDNYEEYLGDEMAETMLEYEGQTYFAYDIRILDGEDEWEPESDDTVTIKIQLEESIPEDKGITVLHIVDSAYGKNIEIVDPENIDLNAARDEVEITASSLSPYLVLEDLTGGIMYATTDVNVEGSGEENDPWILNENVTTLTGDDKGKFWKLPEEGVALNSGLTVEQDTVVYLDLNGQTLSSNTESTIEYIITVKGTLTITDDSGADDGTITGGTKSGIYVNGGTLNLVNGTISGNANGINFDKNKTANVTMSGGSISGNGTETIKEDGSTSYSGNGVSVSGSGTTFTMNGGSISDNKVYGISFGAGTTFTMSEGCISGNRSHGVYINGKNTVFNMDGGRISANKSYGVNAGSGSTFNMTGGIVGTDDITINWSDGSVTNGFNLPEWDNGKTYYIVNIE